MTLIKQHFRFVPVIAAIVFAASAAIFGQTEFRPLPTDPTTPAILFGPEHSERMFRRDETSERSIKVDPNVNISLCVGEGNLKVNSWNRSEVRIFVADGSKFSIRVQLKGPKSGEPALITAVSESDGKSKPGSWSECLHGEEIEIDAPTGTVLNLKGQETATTVDGIRRVNIRNAGGDISVRNVSEGVNAVTYNGDLTVERSSGPMSLEATRGNVLAFDVGPSEIGDLFKAKTTSGAIAVQKLQFRQTEINSISGTVAFNGAIQNGGTYSFSTSNGSIRLTLPTDSACMVAASYGGDFASEFPLKILTENLKGGWVKSITASIGDGNNTMLRVTTNNGTISINKQK